MRDVILLGLGGGLYVVGPSSGLRLRTGVFWILLLQLSIGCAADSSPGSWSPSSRG
ncbi:hypothetical protein KEJ17_02405 [Candidatus Bathyarchaeota archaeon]|nr:hypothetical protein [Candidatus Bathyarchaeota archaeon]